MKRNNNEVEVNDIANVNNDKIQVTNIVQDLSTLTTIPYRSLEKLISKSCWCICDAVEESTLQGKNITAIDIGIGQLVVQVIDNSIQYKFIPSSRLEKYMVDTVVNKKNPMTVNLESTFVNRIVKTYKDLI